MGRAPQDTPVRPGLDQLLEAVSGDGAVRGVERDLVRRARRGRVGLVTNPSAVTAALEPAPDRLVAAGCHLAALFGPEHGVRGAAPDGVAVQTTMDPRLHIPCHSLYGETRKPTAEMLKGLDLMLFDVQDVGARFYTYEATLSLVMEACGEAGIPVCVLDRPNPIGGVAIEGPTLEAAYSSFVGRHAIPIRHGCTLGELGHLFHRRFGVGSEPAVARAAGWRRSQLWPDTGLPWVIPSPNMPTFETALVYPGMCLVEGTNVSEGRGTTRPFEIVGAPWLRSEELAESLNGLGLPGCRFRPQRFQPTASKHRDQACEGIQVHVTERAAFRPVLTGVAVLQALKQGGGAKFEWRRSASGRYPVDLLAGTDQLRLGIDSGRSPEAIAAAWEPGLRQMRAALDDLGLYS